MIDILILHFREIRGNDAHKCSMTRQSRQEFMHRRMGSLGLASRLELAYKLHGHAGCVNDLNFNSCGSLLASGSDDLDIIVWDWQNQRKKFSFESGHNSNVFQSKFLPFKGDTHIVSASRDGQVRLAELSVSGECKVTKRLVQHKGPSNQVAMLFENPHCFLSGGKCLDFK